MTKVKCILGYHDTKFNRHVDIGEEFKVDNERADQLIKAKVVTATTPKETVAKKTRKKKEA